jgi:hypothetical protein
MKKKDKIMQFRDMKNGLLQERKKLAERVAQIDAALNGVSTMTKSLKQPAVLDGGAVPSAPSLAPRPRSGLGRPMGKGASSWGKTRGEVIAAARECLASGPKTKEEVVAFASKRGLKPVGGRSLRQRFDTVLYSRYFKRQGDKFAVKK